MSATTDYPLRLHFQESLNTFWSPDDLWPLVDRARTRRVVQKLRDKGELEWLGSRSRGPARPRHTLASGCRWSALGLNPTAARPAPPHQAAWHLQAGLTADAVGLARGAWQAHCESYDTLAQARVVLHRVLHALGRRGARRQKPARPSGLSRLAPRSTATPPDEATPASTAASLSHLQGDDALLNLGVTSGLAMLFGLFQQNWQLKQRAPHCADMCNDVLETFLTVLRGLAPLALSHSPRLSPVGLQSLDQVAHFLHRCVDPQHTQDVQGSRLCAESLLALAVQRGSLSKILQWILVCLRLLKAQSGSGRAEPQISKGAIQHALGQIKSVTDLPIEEMEHMHRFADLPQRDEDLVDLYEGLLCILAEIVAQSTAYTFRTSPVDRRSSLKSSSSPEASKLRSCSLKSEVFVWGSNSSNQLGEGVRERLLEPKRSEGFQDVMKMEAGQYCTFVLHGDGQVSACGKGSYGRLGFGDSNNQLIPRILKIGGAIKDISSSKGSDGHTLALTEGGEVFSWGDGEYGKLGHGNTTTQKVPKKVVGPFERRTILQISAGYRHSAAVSEEGHLFTWGEGDLGRLGHGDSQSRNIPTQVKDIGLVRQVACGASHTLALSEDSQTVWSFGSGDHGKLGHGEIARIYRPKIIDALQGVHIEKIAAGSQVSMVLSRNGKIWSWGTGSLLGTGSADSAFFVPRAIEELSDQHVVDISVGDSTCLALTQDCDVFAWGTNTIGQCGLGHSNSPVCTPQKIKALAGYPIHQISAGNAHSMAWTTLPTHRQVVLWHKPFCAEFDTATFKTIQDLLTSFGIPPKTSPECEAEGHVEPFKSRDDYHQFLVATVRILSVHFALVNVSNGNGSCLADIDKVSVEETLYRFIDQGDCPDTVYRAVQDCLIKGTKVLIAPMSERVSKASALMHLETMSKGQSLKLRIILQSLSDPLVIGDMLDTRDEDLQRGEQKAIFGFVNILIMRQFRHLLENILKIDLHTGADARSKVTPASATTNPEEEQILFAMIVEIIRINLKDSSKTHGPIYYELGLHQLKFVLKLSGELMETARKILKSEGKEGLERVCTCMNRSLLAHLLKVLVLAMYEVSAVIKKDLLEELQYVQGAGFALERLVCDLEEEVVFDKWNPFMELQMTSTAALSKAYGEFFCQSPPEHLLGPFSSCMEFGIFQNGFLDDHCMLATVKKSIGLMATFMVEIVTSSELNLSEKVDQINRKCLASGLKVLGDEYLLESYVEQLRQVLQDFEGIPVDSTNEESFFTLAFLAQGLVVLMGLKDITELAHEMSASRSLGQLFETISQWKLMEEEDCEDDKPGVQLESHTPCTHYRNKLEKAISVGMLIGRFIPPCTDVNRLKVIEEVKQVLDIYIGTKERFFLDKDLGTYLAARHRYRRQIDSAYPQAVKLLSNYVGLESEPKHLQELILHQQMTCQILAGLLNLELIPPESGEHSQVFHLSFCGGKRPSIQPTSKNHQMMMTILGNMVKEQLSNLDQVDESSLLVMALSVLLVESSKSQSAGDENFLEEFLPLLASEDLKMFPMAHAIAQKLAFQVILLTRFHPLDLPMTQTQALIDSISSFLGTQLLSIETCRNTEDALDFLLFLQLLDSDRGKDKHFMSSVVSFKWLPSLMNVLHLPSSSIRFQLVCLSTIKMVLSAKDGIASSKSDKLTTVDSLFQQINSIMWDAPIARTPIAKECTKVKFEFDPDRSCFVTLEAGGLGIHSPGGQGYCVGKQGFSSGCVQWKFHVIKETKGNEGSCVGVTVGTVKDFNHRSTKDMWLYRAYSGHLYHNGELRKILPDFTQGDVITAFLDLEDRTLSFAKNNEPPQLAFSELPSNVELFPCVSFYSLNPGERVQISDVLQSVKSFDMVCGKPFCAPQSENLAQGMVNMLRGAYSAHPVWREAIEEHIYGVLRSDKLAKSLTHVRDGFHSLRECSTSVVPKVDHLIRLIYPCLAFLSGIDEGLSVGSVIELSQNGKLGMVLGSPTNSIPSIKVFWLEDGTRSIMSPEKIFNAGSVVSTAHHHQLDFAPLRNEKLLKALNQLSTLDLGYSDFAKLDLHNLVQKLEVRVTPSPKSRKNIEYASLVGANLMKSKRQPGPMSRTCSPSSTELFSDNLVSSILDEVRGNAPSRCRSRSPIVRDDNLGDDGDHVDSEGDEALARVSETPLTIAELELTLLKLLGLQKMASNAVRQALRTDFHSDLFTPDDEANISAIQLLKASLKNALSSLDLKAPAQLSNHSLLYHPDEINRALAICRSNATSHIKSTAKAKGQLPSRSRVGACTPRIPSVRSGEEAAHGPIFRPLFEMGFSNTHISRALAALNINSFDTSAPAINRCASWMIDHPLPDMSTYSMERLRSRGRPPFERGSRGWSDIRDFFTTEQESAISAAGESASTPRRQSTPEGPIPTPNPVRDQLSGAASGSEPWASAFRACFNSSRTRTRNTGAGGSMRSGSCGICFEVILGPMTQHQRQSHPGCDKPLDNAICGGLLEDKYVLCQSCIGQYAEITHSMPSTDILDTSRTATGVPLAPGLGSIPQFVREQVGNLTVCNELAPDLLPPAGKLYIREKLNAPPAVVIEESGVLPMNMDDMSKQINFFRAKMMVFKNLEDDMSGKPLFPLDSRAPSDALGQDQIHGHSSLYFRWQDNRSARLKPKPRDGGIEHREPPPPVSPLWHQAFQLRGKVENVLALSRLQAIIHLQSGLELVFYVLEQAASLAQMGKYSTGAELLSRFDLNDAGLLYGLVKRLARMEMEISERELIHPKQSGAEMNTRSMLEGTEDQARPKFQDVRRKIQISMLALKCMVQTNGDAAKTAANLALYTLTCWIKLDYYVNYPDMWLLRQNAFLDQMILEDLVASIGHNLAHPSHSPEGKPMKKVEDEELESHEEVENRQNGSREPMSSSRTHDNMTPVFLQLDSHICETLTTLLLNWKAPTQLRMWSSKLLLSSLTQRVRSNPLFQNVDHADYESVLPLLYIHQDELNVIEPRTVYSIVPTVDHTQAAAVEGQVNIHIMNQCGIYRAGRISLPEDAADSMVQCAWSPCQRKLAISYGTNLCIWHNAVEESGRLFNSLEHEQQDKDVLLQMSPVSALHWSTPPQGCPNNRRSQLLLGRLDGTVAALSHDGIQEMLGVTRPSVPVEYVAWLNDPDENTFLVAFEDGKIIQGTPTSQDTFKQVQTEESSIHQFKLSSNSLILASVAKEKKFVSIWGRSLGEFSSCPIQLPHPSVVETIDWSPLIREKVCLAVGQRDGGIALWQIDSSGFGKPEHCQLLWGHPYQPVRLLKFHPAGNLLASASQKGSDSLLNVWSLSTGSVIHTDVVDGDAIQDCAWIANELESKLLVNFKVAKTDVRTISFPSHFGLFNMEIASGCRSALLGKGADVLYQTRNLKQFLQHLGTFLREQYAEESEEGSERAIKYSGFLQDLLRLVVELNLDRVFMDNALMRPLKDDANDILYDAVDWSWALDYIYSIRALKALSSRTKKDSNKFQAIATTFMEKSGERIDPHFEAQITGGLGINSASIDLEPVLEMEASTHSVASSGGVSSSETQSGCVSLLSSTTEPAHTWSMGCDAQLMQWATEFPTDWQVGGKCQAYGFGIGRSGQLAELGCSDVRIPQGIDSFCEARQIVCALNCTFIIHSNGSVSACGENGNGRLGLGNSEDQQVLAAISSLKGFSICQLASSKSGEGHTLALATSGEVFSWGDGDWGKLGHGNSDRVRRPRPITTLRHHSGLDPQDSALNIRFVATGFRHSALISKEGHVYTFGKGDLGALGHGTTSTLRQPHLVADLTRRKIGLVACGSNHTVCVSRDGLQSWSFGGNECGQLGIGSTAGALSPKRIESLNGLQVKKVSLGDAFSVFLTSKGQVLTCGQHKMTGLPQILTNLHRPTQIPAFELEHVFIVDITVGATHTLALSNKGEVWIWGRDGLESPDAWVLQPRIVADLSHKFILQISAGSYHSIAWTTPPLQPTFDDTPHLPNLGLPAAVPPKFTLLANISIHALRDRLKVLYLASNLVAQSWKFYPSVEDRNLLEPLARDEIRLILSQKVYTLPLVQILQKTMTSSRNLWPQVVVRRLHLPSEHNDENCPKTIFAQIAKQVQKLEPAELRFQDRAWKVKLMGEGADDAGGVFDDIMTEMCRELIDAKSGLQLLIPTPNGVTNIGLNRDTFLLNSRKSSSHDLRNFWFIGILCGVAIRTRKPIALNLAPFVWKMIVGSQITWNDLDEVDLNYARSLKSLDDPHLAENHLLPNEYFQGIAFAGQMVSLLPEQLVLKPQDCPDYVQAAFEQRIREMLPQVKALREGLGGIVPFPILGLMPAKALEELVCGQPSISLTALKKAARYRDFDPSHPIIVWFWDILDHFTEEERVLFVIFVSGRSRLPNNLADLPQRFQILRVDRPENGLPTAQTCFFQLRLPPFTSQAIMQEKLRYAIYHCRSIDMDQYMLRRDSANGTPN